MDDDAGAARVAKAYCWTFGNAEFDEGRWQLRVAGQDIELERKPQEVLQHLLCHAGEAVTKEELLSSVWAGRVVVEAVLTNAIGKLRKALGDDAQDIVMTLPRVGYRLAAPVSRKAVEFLPQASRLEVGDTVPRRQNWKLESALARTGGNEVWLARHAKTNETRVFKFSLTGKGLNGLKREVTIARLLREALGEREDFLRVMDWDFEDAPYFVESQYGGISLDHWPQGGDIAGISIERKLALFIDAAEAVAAAHGIGVLHKDLKPANLLVYGEGDDARLRVADFGSSRLFDSGRLDELGITHLGLTQTQSLSSSSGTPLYLAPEIAAGHSATIKSDVYALGVTLYQLLVGDFRRPLALGWESDITDPLLRKDIADAANGDPAKRLESAAVLAARLRNLTSRREKSALELVVQARVEEGEKRLAKVRARRPWMMAAMLVFGLAFVAWSLLLQRTWHSEQRATVERDAAIAMNEFINRDILQYTDPFAAGSASLSMREVLDAAAPKIDQRFPATPDVAAPLHATVASAYDHLADYSSGIKHHRKAIELYSSEKRADREKIVDQMIEIAISLAKSGDNSGAVSELDKIPVEIQNIAPERRIRLQISYGRALALVSWQTQNWMDSVPPLEDAYAKLALLPEPDPVLELSIREALMVARGRAGLPSGNLVALQENAIKDMQASRNSQRMPLALAARYGVLRVRMLAGEERSLEKEYREMIAELTEVIGPRNEGTLLAMHGLSVIYAKQERWSECEQISTHVSEELENLHGLKHIHTANALNQYGVCLLGQRKLEQAGNIFSKTLKELESVDGVKVGLVRVAIQINESHVLAGLKKWDELALVLNEIKRNGSTLLKADSDALGEVELSEGRLQAARGDIVGARSRIQHSIHQLSKKNPKNYWILVLANSELEKAERVLKLAEVRGEEG